MKSVYMSYNDRCRFAVETFRSITASAWEQVTELELMWLDSQYLETDIIEDMPGDDWAPITE